MSCTVISVLLPAYNAERHIAKAIESVLAQSFADFELLVLDDGSTDCTRKIVQGYTDERIKLIACSHNFIATLNKGIELAEGKYIARMDADDVMHIDRLGMQYQLMEDAPEISLCSSWASYYNERIGTMQPSRGLSGLISIPELELLAANVLIHPTVMMRRSFLLDNHLSYRDGYPCAEDYKLWVEMALLGAKFYIEPEPLVLYRLHEEQVSHRRQDIQIDSARRVRRELLEALLEREEFAAYKPFVASGEKLSKQGLISEREFTLWLQGQLKKYILRQNLDSVL